jgi:hypothetical protein
MIPFSVEFEEERWDLRDDVDGLKAFDDAAGAVQAESSCDP